MDESSPDSLAHSGEDIHGSGASIEDLDVHHIARWHDVHRAAAKLAAENWLAEVSQRLAVNGETQETVANTYGISQPTLSRKYKAGVDEILEELNRPTRIELQPALDENTKALYENTEALLRQQQLDAA